MTLPNQSTLPGADDILRCELENGIVILARPNFNSPSISLQGYLAAGSINDPVDKLGLASFTASALMRGVQRRDFQAIYNELETVGASLGFSCGTLTTSFYGRALVEDLGMLLGLLREALLEPVFPSEQVERLRAQQLTSLAIRAQDTAAMASLTFDSLLFASHPYGRPEDGYPETITAITRQDMVDFHRLQYGPQGMVIVIVGAVQPQLAVDLASQAFSAWRNPAHQPIQALPPAPGLPAPQRQHVPIPGKSQADLYLGVVGPERRSPDYLPASLGNNILGQFGMYGRIGESVRETAGLAYYAYSNLSSGIGPGVWYAGAGVEAGDLEQTIEMILAEIRRFSGEPVNAQELEDTQSNYIGRLPLGLESNAGVVSALINLERYNLGLDYYRQYASLIRSVSREQILEVARRYFDLNQLVIASAG
jgi:zinc protease